MLLKVLSNLRDPNDLDQGFIEESPEGDPSANTFKSDNFSQMLIDTDDNFNINKINPQMANNHFLIKLGQMEIEALSRDKKQFPKQTFDLLMHKINGISVKSKELIIYKKFNKKRHKKKLK
jgi:hypothetical protein